MQVNLNPVDFTQIAATNSEKNVMPEGKDFLSMVKKEQEALKTEGASENHSEDKSEKIEHSEEKSDKEALVSKAEKSDSKNEEASDSKISSKTEKKAEQIEQAKNDVEEIPENLIATNVQAANLVSDAIKNSESIQDENKGELFDAKIVVKKSSFDITEEDAVVEQEKIDYLLNSRNKDFYDNLIENAAEYEAEADIEQKQAVLLAQNQSVDEPEFFLESIQTEPVSNVKNVSDSFEKKIAEPKKSGKKLLDKITVTDLRTEKNQSEKIMPERNLKKSDIVVHAVEKNVPEVTMEIGSNVNQNILSLNNQAAGAQGSNFQAMLTNQIQQNAPDFVKAGSIVLKDNNNGTINLVLHPEALGNVKITLEMTEKGVQGHIHVSSEAAYNAFKDSINTLKVAFNQSGFENASFDLSYSQSQNFSGFGEQQNNSDNERKSRVVYGEFVSENSSVALESADNLSETNDYSVNIVA